MESFKPEYQIQQIEAKIVVALERISEAFKVLLWQRGKELGLTPLQLQVLLFIQFHGPEKCKVNYLADEFNLAKATISETIRLLANKELITKHRDPADSRSYSIHLSEKGKEIADKAGNFAQAIEKPLHDFSESRKEALYKDLKDLMLKLSAAGVINVQRMCHSCRFFEKGQDQHYCRFLEKKLAQAEIRLDCPEHQGLT